MYIRVCVFVRDTPIAWLPATQTLRTQTRDCNRPLRWLPATQSLRTQTRDNPTPIIKLKTPCTPMHRKNVKPY